MTADNFTPRGDALKFACLLFCCSIGAALLSSCGSAAAQPRRSVVIVADAQIKAVCNGPATMTGCLVSVFDSTAGLPLAVNVAVAKGDTLTRIRPCTANETIVIGGQFIGTRAGATNSAPVGARGTGACTAQAGQPSPVIVIQVTP
jgi:hypothetical protein